MLLILVAIVVHGLMDDGIILVEPVNRLSIFLNSWEVLLRVILSPFVNRRRRHVCRKIYLLLVSCRLDAWDEVV